VKIEVACLGYWLSELLVEKEKVMSKKAIKRAELVRAMWDATFGAEVVVTKKGKAKKSPRPAAVKVIWTGAVGRC
jgi:hypothetical protein